jgi:hypothetical protein
VQTAGGRARWRDFASLVGGLTLAAYGLFALISIPHGPHEFVYDIPAGGNAWWPLPFAPGNGFTPEQLSSHVARALFLFPASVLIGYAWRRVRLRTSTLPSAWWLIATSVLIAVVVAAFVLRGVPLQDDEATYVMQAELLTQGLVADPTMPATMAFSEPFTIFTWAGMSGMYEFGTPLVLALGLPWGLPWIGEVALLALTLWCAFQAAARGGQEIVAWIACLLLAISPMLTFTSASTLSQTPALAGTALAVLGLAVGGWRGGVLMGTGLGFVLAARPQVAYPAGLALAFYAWRDRRLVIAMLLAAIPWLVAVGLYNQAVMGSPWVLPRAAYTGVMEAYGFGDIARHYTYTPLKAIALAGVALVRLNGWALGWPISLLGPVLWLALGRPHRRIVGPWAAVALMTFVFQAGYGFLGTSETGALYHYAAIPFFAFSTAAVLHEVGERQWGGWIHATALACVLLGTATFYVEHATRLSRLSTLIEGPRRTMARELRMPALVFEDAFPARPQTGWVFGIPFRERSSRSPIVRYPRPAAAAELERLIERWPERSCSYLTYDWSASQYRVESCTQIGAAHSPRPAGRPPWFADGRWREAFPYLPFSAVS